MSAETAGPEHEMTVHTEQRFYVDLHVIDRGWVSETSRPTLEDGQFARDYWGEHYDRKYYDDVRLRKVAKVIVSTEQVL